MVLKRTEECPLGVVAAEYRGVFISTMLRRVAKRMVGDVCVVCGGDSSCRAGEVSQSFLAQ